MTEAKKTPLEPRFTIPYVTLYELLVHAVVAFLTFWKKIDTKFVLDNFVMSTIYILWLFSEPNLS